jgi:hypothetical protein
MKKRTGMILAVVAFFVGTVAGFLVCSYCWSRVAEENTVSESLNKVWLAYFPLKLIKDGQTDQAIKHLQTELHLDLQVVDTIADYRHRPDMLTNSIVVNARALDGK